MRTCGAGRSSEPPGFTLVELAVVILILTVTFGLVLPKISSGLWQNDLKTSSRRLAGAVAQARTRAMVEGCIWTLMLDLKAGTFWTTAKVEDEVAEPENYEKRALAGEVRFMDVQKPQEGTKTSSGRTALRFQPKGLAEPAVIHLAGPGDRVQTLFVKAFNARVAIREGYLEREEEAVGSRQ